MGNFRKQLVTTDRSVLTLMLALVLLIVQVTGLHCDIQQSEVGQEPDTMVHVQHLGTSATCEEDTCDRDLSAPVFWKSLDQGWDSVALLVVAFILLSPVLGRIAIPLRPGEPFLYSQPIFLRPLLRAPPL